MGSTSADGSGASSVVTSIFTSTGNLGSVGTPKDVINDADGNKVATVTLTATGGTETVSLIVTKLGFTTSTQPIVAGSAPTAITAQTQDEIGAKNDGISIGVVLLGLSLLALVSILGRNARLAKNRREATR